MRFCRTGTAQRGAPIFYHAHADHIFSRHAVSARVSTRRWGRQFKEFESRDSNLEIRLKICANCIDKIDNSINMNERTNKIKHTESSNESECVQNIIEKSKMETWNFSRIINNFFRNMDFILGSTTIFNIYFINCGSSGYQQICPFIKPQISLRYTVFYSN